MFKHTIPIILFAFIPVFFSCSDNRMDTKQSIVLTINGYEMTKTEFQTECKADMEYKDNEKTSDKVKQERLNYIIQKELLIQEAQKSGLDKDTKFMLAIERYWEATLIKLLMEQKSNEIQNTTQVSDSEIKQKYDLYKSKDENIPELSTVKTEIANQILENKKADALENWIDSLHQKANIKIEKNIFSE